jgi:hypothetical protein
MGVPRASSSGTVGFVSHVARRAPIVSYAQNTQFVDGTVRA